MVVINFAGALGNQLFQYALYKKLVSLGVDVRADLSSYSNGMEHRFFYLDKLGISLIEASERDISRVMPSRGCINAIKDKLGLCKYYTEKQTYSFDREILKIRNGYLEGYWQCPKYFDDIRLDIVNSISFPKLPDEQLETEEQICSTESVFVHVRRGDYVELSEKYGNICTKQYYEKAFSYIESKVSNPVYFGFSDDVKAANEMFPDVPVHWINYNTEETAYYDMLLMTKCKHAIIANSSFSWWGAYLGKRSDSIVVAPSKWTNTSDQECDIWCDDWYRC